MLKIPRKLYDCRWKQVLWVAVLLMIARELSPWDFHAYSVKTETLFTTDGRPASGRTPLTRSDFDYSILPSPLDYVPFYKSRTFEGTILAGAKSDPSAPYVEIHYNITLRVKGPCSAKAFRRMAREQIDETIEKMIRRGESK